MNETDIDYLDYISDEIVHPWYYYQCAAPKYARFDPDGRIPPGWIGPYQTRREAVEAYRRWLLGRPDDDE